MKKYILAICVIFAGFNLQAESNISTDDVAEKSSAQTTENYIATTNNKKVNIHVNPIVILVGLINAGVDVAISPKFTLGLDGAYWGISIEDVEVSLIMGGLRAGYFFEEVFTDSPYLFAKANYLSGSVKDIFSEVDMSGFTVGVGGGYMWMWENFNFQLGLGVGYTKLDLDLDASELDGPDVSNFDGVGVLFEFKLGYAF